MSNYIPLVKHSTIFEGDTVTMNLKTVRRDDMMELMQYVEIERLDNGSAKVTFKDQTGYLDATVKFVPKYVTDFEGLTDAQGNPIDLETVVGEFYFNQLTLDIVAKLFEISAVKGDDQKKSGE